METNTLAPFQRKYSESAIHEAVTRYLNGEGSYNEIAKQYDFSKDLLGFYVRKERKRLEKQKREERHKKEQTKIEEKQAKSEEVEKKQNRKPAAKPNPDCRPSLPTGDNWVFTPFSELGFFSAEEINVIASHFNQNRRQNDFFITGTGIANQYVLTVVTPKDGYDREIVKNIVLRASLLFMSRQ